ncbi:MAG: ABC transporter ATP-binding protein [Janthinobacterium lividum]
MNRLEVFDVHKTYGKGKHAVKASDGVTFSIPAGQTLGLIGESGSGKSTIGRICLGAEASDRGRLTMDGAVFSNMDRASLATWRRRSSIVLQEPELALNPRRTVGQSVCEPLQVLLQGVSAREIRERGENALELAHLSPSLWDRYPSELSGGQQQRVGIARAVVTEPDFIVLDEPTASLDLSVRSKIIDTLCELQARMNVSYLLITHDMATVAALAQTVAVLYKGKVVEQGDRRLVLESPQNPYTQKLMSAVLKVRTR